jgi:DNA mismatch endonuclease (patch repair protein)
MSRLGRRDTRPEIELRSELHRRGRRFRVDCRPDPQIRAKADIVFTKARVAVFVDGCFWHVCPEHQTWPQSNADWWRHKLEGNVARDRRADAALTAAGWDVVRVWEHQSPTEAADQVEVSLARRARPMVSSATRSDPIRTGEHVPPAREENTWR